MCSEKATVEGAGSRERGWYLMMKNLIIFLRDLLRGVLPPAVRDNASASPWDGWKQRWFRANAMLAALQEASPDGMFWKKKLGCEQGEGGGDSVAEAVDENNMESQRAQGTLLRRVRHGHHLRDGV